MKDLFYLILTLALLEGVFGVRVSSAIRDGAASLSQGQPFSGQIGQYFGEPTFSPPGGSGVTQESPEASGSIVDTAKDFIQNTTGMGSSSTEDDSGTSTETTKDQFKGTEGKGAN